MRVLHKPDPSVSLINHEDKSLFGFFKYSQKIVPDSAGYINPGFRISIFQVLIDAVLNAVDILMKAAAISWSSAKINENYIMLVKMFSTVFIFCNCEIIKCADV